MKHVILADTHFGVRGNKAVFHDNMELFYSKVFFPYLESLHRPLDIIHLGDLFDDRKKIDTFTARRATEYFFNPLDNYLTKNNKTLYFILGNHDIYYRNILDVNTVDEFINNHQYKSGTKFRIKIINTPSMLDNMLLLPWLTKNNKEEFLAAAKQFTVGYDQRFLLGHLELLGHNYSKVQVAAHGDDPEVFAGYEKVISGHYHYKNNKGNVYYLGSPTQHTWIDVDTPKGFHIFDTETGELEFIENPYNIFQIVELNEKLKDPIIPRMYRVRQDAGHKQSEVDLYVNYLYDNKAINVEVLNPRGEAKMITSDGSVVAIDSVEDTPTFIRSYVADNDVADLLVDLYNRATNEN